MEFLCSKYKHKTPSLFLFIEKMGIYSIKTITYNFADKIDLSPFERLK
jgi:hypothetical protein